MGLQMLSYFLNSDMYLQVSGMFIFLFLAILSGMGWVLLHVWRSPINAYQTISLLFGVCIVLSIIANPTAIESGYLFSYFLLICMLFVFSSLKLDKRDFNKLSGAYIVLGMIISLLIIVVRKRFYADEANRITIQIGGNPLIDPNYLGACLVGPSFLSLQHMFEGNCRKIKIAGLVATAVILIGIFMTGSRGALLAWAGGVFVVICKKFFKHFTIKKFALLGLVVIAGGVAALFIIPQEYLTRMFDISSWMDPSNVRRLALWDNAVKHILKNPWLGYGLGSPVKTIGHAAHNTYLELFVQFGAVGGVLFIVLLCMLLFRKGDIFMKAIVLSTMIWSVFIAAEATMFLWLNISLCIAYNNLKKGSSDEKDCQHNCSGLQC